MLRVATMTTALAPHVQPLHCRATYPAGSAGTTPRTDPVVEDAIALVVLTLSGGHLARPAILAVVGAPGRLARVLVTARGVYAALIVHNADTVRAVRDNGSLHVPELEAREQVDVRVEPGHCDVIQRVVTVLVEGTLELLAQYEDHRNGALYLTFVNEVVQHVTCQSLDVDLHLRLGVPH